MSVRRRRRGRADEQCRTSFPRSPVTLSSIFPLKSREYGEDGPLVPTTPPSAEQRSRKCQRSPGARGSCPSAAPPTPLAATVAGSHLVVWPRGKLGLTRKTKQNKQNLCQFPETQFVTGKMRRALLALTRECFYSHVRTKPINRSHPRSLSF